MKEIQLLNAYFSPTGTTYSIAKTIAEGTGCPVAEMDLSDPNCSAELKDNTVLLASAPVYGGRIPGVALERLHLQPEECLMVGNDVGEDMITAQLGMKVFLLTDCLINKQDADISFYPHGGFDVLSGYLEDL